MFVAADDALGDIILQTYPAKRFSTDVLSFAEENEDILQNNLDELST